MSADRNLLFGILALQMDFITRDALIAAMAAWVMEKHRPLGDILVERKALDPIDRAALDPMIARHLARHGGDPARSLAALSSAEGVASDLRRSFGGDPDLLASLDAIPPGTRAEDPFATRPYYPADHSPAGTRFRKVREHASGNLGVVYIARDEELNREVALKEIKEKNADQPYNQAKFLLEAEVTGRLEHPGIVPVYGLGHHDDGRPFYAMRFIRGRSLLDAIRRFHADGSLKSDPGARSLALQKLLRRFTDVCNAIEYAHSRGVLHRDLKPDNVMVGQYGETLVVDWGLAKALGRSGDPRAVGDHDDPLPEATLEPATAEDLEATRAGSVVGTPAYMSPEQAAGRLDLLGPASDVYGLGASLYHLIAARPPIEAETLGELLAKVRSGDIPRPRSLTSWIDPALEAICLKAMALRPDDRYPTARALADDLDRWIAGAPVVAYPEPFVRRARRWARKHRTAVTAVSASTLVAALLIGISIRASHDRTRRAEAEGLATLARAEFLVAEARKTSDPARWSEAVAEARRALAQLESGGGGDEAKTRARAQLAGSEEALRVVERDRKMVSDLDEAQLSGISMNVKDGHFDLEGRADAIVDTFRSYGIDLATLSAEEAAARVRSSRIALRLIAALHEATHLSTRPLRKRWFAVARLADTDALGIQIRERMARKDFEGLRGMVAEEAGRRALGPRCRTISTLLTTLDPAASLPALEAIQRTNRSDFWLTFDLAEAYQKARPPRLESAIRHYYAAVSLRPTSPGVLINLSLALMDKGEVDEAIAFCREAIRLRPDFAEAHHNLGTALHAKGESEAAIASLLEAIRLRPDFAEAHNNLGTALDAKGGSDAAIAAYRKAIQLKPEYAGAHANLGAALGSKGDIEAAMAACRKAIQLDPDLAEAHGYLGATLLRMRDHEAAIAELLEAIRLKPGNPTAYSNLGAALRLQGDSEGAIAAYHKAIELKPDFAEAHCNLGLALQFRGRFAEALKSLERGHELGSRQAGWRNPSAKMVLQCRRLLALDAKLSALMKGEASSVEPGERLELADLCYGKGLFATASRLYGQAFADRPELADDLEAGHRYNAAFNAALAGSGVGKDAPPPDEATRTRLRGQALVWLRADLAAHAKVLEGGDPKAHESLVGTLDHWRRDPDLAGIRDEAGLSKLPEAEREAFRSLWADVETLRVKAGGAK